MENILTKEEIEALLDAVFAGRIDPDKELARESSGVVKYDLFNSDAKRTFVPNLDIIYDSFIRYSRINMSNRLRKIVEFKKLGAQVYKFDDFLQTLPSPVCLAIHKLEPLKGAAIIALDSSLVFTVVDSVLGGSGKATIPGGSRMFTSIELRLIEKMIKDMLVDMEKAWAPVQEVKLNLLKLEMNPRLVSIVPPDYQVLTMGLQMQVEEAVGTMTFAVPISTIDPLRDKLKSGTQFDMMAVDPQWSFRLTRELRQAPLELAVELGSATITLDELLHLAPGDTVMLDRQEHEPLLVKVGDIPKFNGSPGVSHGNKAVLVTGTVQRGGEL